MGKEVKESVFNNIIKDTSDTFHDTGKKDISKKENTRIKRLFYITPYCDRKLNEYKAKTGVSKSSILELLIREAFKDE